MEQDTIAAIATPVAAGGIGIVRISGSGAFSVAGDIFQANSGKSLSVIPAYRAALGHVYAGGRPVDECIALIFRAPKSYTGEDVVELQCHGGVYILRCILEAALNAGARLALPGEFTKRAFLNGRIDLTRAEAVMELISAKGEQAAKAALAQHEGALYRRIVQIKTTLYDLSADICAFVDFPEEDIPDLSEPVLKQKLVKLLEEIGACAATFEKGKVQREGITTVIAGSPNVGKSTLMNLIAGCEKSIVTSVPGTTRDIVEESVIFAGLPLNLADTAGLRDTADEVERIGVARTRARMKNAALIFAVFDASSSLKEEDDELIVSLRGKTAVAVLNKCDLPVKIDEKYITSNIKNTVKVSAKTGAGLQTLEKVTASLFEETGFDPGEGIVENERQFECVRRAQDGVSAALEALESGITLDAVSTGIEQAVSALSELTGERASQDIIDRVFEKFCVGK